MHMSIPEQLVSCWRKLIKVMERCVDQIPPVEDESVRPPKVPLWRVNVVFIGWWLRLRPWTCTCVLVLQRTGAVLCSVSDSVKYSHSQPWHCACAVSGPDTQHNTCWPQLSIITTESARDIGHREVMFSWHFRYDKIKSSGYNSKKGLYRTLY